MKITPLDAWAAGRIGRPGERVTREALDAHTLDALRETIRHARARSRFYAARLEGAGDEPLSRIEDLARLPFTTPGDLRADPAAFLCLSSGEIERVVTLPTSGTTGEPKRLHFTREELDSTLDFFLHGITTLARPGDVVLSILPGLRPGGVNDLLARAVRGAGARWVSPEALGDPSAVLERMGREAVSVLVGAPAPVLALARLGVSSGHGAVAPRAVLLSTDSLPRSVADGIRRAWGCEVFEHYGMTEMGFGGALECDAHFGCHWRECDLYFEVVDSVHGQPLPDGETGEVVFTTLARRGMPLIRYRTGDLARMMVGRCPCGSALRVLGRVTGRLDGVTPLPGGGAIALADLDELLFSLDGVLDFRAELLRTEPAWRLKVELLVTEQASANVAEWARRGIEGLDALRSPFVSGGLLVDVTVSKGDSIFSYGGGKRVLMIR